MAQINLPQDGIDTAISPREMAVMLAAQGYSDKETATAIHEFFKNKGGISALDLGAAILDKQAFPNTDNSGMRELLKACSYKEAEIAQALKILYPATINVQSTQAWQKTGVTVDAAEIAVIEAPSGEWFISPQCDFVDADGGRRLISLPGYAMPGAPEGALIARVGGKTLLAGKHYEVPVGICGEIELCPNDDLDGRYGKGLRDNSGSITVKITVRLR
jgi:hypothetical protein